MTKESPDVSRERESFEAIGTTTYEFRATAEMRFAVGQIVHHTLFDYRGVIADAHPTFQSADAWYEKVAETRPPKDKPWYEVLVNGSDRVTYVAERNLEIDQTGMPIEHPLIRVFFNEFSGGFYRVGGPKN